MKSGVDSRKTQVRIIPWVGLQERGAGGIPEDHKSVQTPQQRPLEKPNEPMNSSIGKPKMGAGFMNDPKVRKNSRCHWHQILLLGERKSN
jgi:hypothetical protein